MHGRIFSSANRITTMWQDWVNAILGLVVIAVAFMGLTGATLGWTLGVLGVIIALIGFWGAATTTSGLTERHV